MRRSNHAVHDAPETATARIDSLPLGDRPSLNAPITMPPSLRGTATLEHMHVPEPAAWQIPVRRPPTACKDAWTLR